MLLKVFRLVRRKRVANNSPESLSASNTCCEHFSWADRGQGELIVRLLQRLFQRAFASLLQLFLLFYTVSNLFFPCPSQSNCWLLLIFWKSNSRVCLCISTDTSCQKCAHENMLDAQSQSVIVLQKQSDQLRKGQDQSDWQHNVCRTTSRYNNNERLTLMSLRNELCRSNPREADLDEWSHRYLASNRHSPGETIRWLDGRIRLFYGIFRPGNSEWLRCTVIHCNTAPYTTTVYFGPNPPRIRLP